MEEDQSPARPSILDKTNQFSKQKGQSKEWRVGTLIKNYEHAYVYSSLVLVRGKNFNQMKAQLKKNRYDCELTNPFGHLNLIGANFLAILYHNNPHSEVTQNIRKSTDFMFEGRQTQIAPIKDMLRLVNRNGKRMLPKGDFDDLQKWATQQFDNIIISLWRYINDDGETELYLKTGNDACTALMYLVLNNQGERAHIKNPKDIDATKCIFTASQ